mmetsp:Transcript_26110/g.68997  ORF Transcript_26110/g.68997 Transcript_26110/m.68997 type:complete len:159 (+) Transcript_26110:94-570(+)
MVKPAKNRKRTPGNKSGKAAVKKHQKMNKKNQKRKQAKKVDDLADRLASGATVSITAASLAEAMNPGARDDDMSGSAPKAARGTVDKAALKKKLRAAISGHQLDRTKNLYEEGAKGKTDSRGLNLRDEVVAVRAGRRAALPPKKMPRGMNRPPKPAPI